MEILDEDNDEGKEKDGDVGRLDGGGDLCCGLV